MSKDLKTLFSIYEVKPAPRRNLKPKYMHKKKLTNIVQSVSEQNLGHDRTDKAVLKQRIRKEMTRPKNLSIEPRKRTLSNDNIIQTAAKNILSSSLDDDLQKLENLTARNTCIRNDWLKVQKKVLQMGVSKHLNTIKETDEYMIDYFPENLYVNPVEVLMQKYEAHKRNKSHTIYT